MDKDVSYLPRIFFFRFYLFSFSVGSFLPVTFSSCRESCEILAGAGEATLCCLMGVLFAVFLLVEIAALGK